MLSPSQFNQETLAAIVREIVEVLYLDENDLFRSFLDSDKNWDSDTLDEISDILRKFHLTPPPSKS